MSQRVSKREAGEYTAGDLAREVGATLRTVRFYEEVGLLLPIRRSRGNHRLYGEDAIRRLRVILDLTAAGMQLSEIRQIFEIRDRASSNAEAVTRFNGILKERLEEVRQKLDTLERVNNAMRYTRDLLAECASCQQPSDGSQCPHCDVAHRASSADDSGQIFHDVWVRPKPEG
ncbi:MAG: hypothetical protein GMKNLPBB_00869 [Myxococcota bacterium]|nr:hypothetical protein [Myxococcota bacterium]